MARRRQKRKKQKKGRPPERDTNLLRSKDLKSTVQRARDAGVPEEECADLDAVIDTLEWVSAELEDKTLTLARLRSLFGIAGSEKTKKILADLADAIDEETKDEASKPDATGESEDDTSDKNRKGHGRASAKDYTGAEVVSVAHPTLGSGDACPDCDRGKVYEQKARPRRLVRVGGQAPIFATVYELQSLRCNLCGMIFTADPPEGIGARKYDETAASMIGLLKYGSGMPFNRLQGLERNLGIPLPASTQWEIVAETAARIEPAHQELIRQAAQGQILHNDDTAARILSLMKENAALEASGEADDGARTGIFTTGIVATADEGARRIALFLSGRKHAGENADDVLRHRAEELSAPIQMCDGLDRNVPKELETILANCLAHGRRKFVAVVDSFPQDCRYVLEQLGKVYKHDAESKEQELTPQARLEHHQEESAPVMKELEAWMKQQLDDKLVEPNSSLGLAIRYMLKRWSKLTLFLREPGAPLDNNVCERALKMAIRHRKNSLFFKTENGARVGDIFMSLIHSAELAAANPFDYLVELQKHADEVKSDPGRWMPWGYRDTLEEIGSAQTDR